MSTAYFYKKDCFFSSVNLILLATANFKVENANTLVKKKVQNFFSTAAWVNCFKTILKGPSTKKKT